VEVQAGNIIAVSSKVPNQLSVDNGFIALWIYGGILFMLTSVALMLATIGVVGSRARALGRPLAYAIWAMLIALVFANCFDNVVDEFAALSAVFFAVYGRQGGEAVTHQEQRAAADRPALAGPQWQNEKRVSP
jgi:uncharacterized membrane protein YhaH (DUF805 family)